MFGTTIGILYLGHKNGTPNTNLWALFPFIRGIHWLIEFVADYYEEILDIEMPIFDRLELFTAFTSSFVLLAACLEFNGVIRHPFGKLMAAIASITPICLIFILRDDTIEDIEDTIFFRGFIATSDPPRFLYGFILPLISIIAIISTYIYYRHQVKKGKISSNPKMSRITLIIIVLILLFSIFEGFDYEEYEEYTTIFVGLRAITLSIFIIIPLFVIYTSDLGLQRFFVIEHSGLPLLIYNFKTKTVLTDELSFLTSGFLTAIVGFSDELSKSKGGFLSIRSRYLYYSILKTERKLYAIQSILYNNKLENTFYSAAKQIDNLISELNKNLALDALKVKEILDNNFSIFY
jgi:hypothetical protein